MPRITAARKSARRRQLVEAAWRCAAKVGFGDLTVDDICAEARLSKGAFYLYFAQKLDVLLALYEGDADQLDELMAKLDAKEPDHRLRLRRYAHAVLNRGSEPSRVQVGADVWTAMLTEPQIRRAITQRMQARRARLRSWIESAVAEGELVDIPANAFASILLALADGLLIHGSLDPTAFRWANIGKAVDVILGGISA